MLLKTGKPIQNDYPLGAFYKQGATKNWGQILWLGLMEFKTIQISACPLEAIKEKFEAQTFKTDTVVVDPKIYDMWTKYPNGQ